MTWLIQKGYEDKVTEEYLVSAKKVRVFVGFNCTTRSENVLL